MSHYTINRIKGEIQFKCIRCEYSVSTLDFDDRDGNLRTQAATAINRHAAEVHHQPTMYSSRDAQQRELSHRVRQLFKHRLSLKFTPPSW